MSDEHAHGWVIEGQPSLSGVRLFWRNGHGWMKALRQATIFVKKNDAISKCVSLGSSACTVLEAEFSTGHAVYPPSKTKSPADWMKRPYFVDPSEGWRYGFPLLYDPAKDGDMTSWLIENGYPETLTKQGRPCRFIEAPEVK